MVASPIRAIALNTTMEIYNFMTRAGLCRSRRQLSVEWFGMAPNYVCLLGDQRPPSDSAMLTLIRRLIDRRRYILAAHVLRMLLWPTQPDRKLPWGS